MAKTNRAPEREAAVTEKPVVVELRSLRTPFSSRQDQLLWRANVLARHVGRVTVVNTGVRGTIPAEDQPALDDILYELRSSGRLIEYVNAFSEFYDGPKQFANLAGKNTEELRQLTEALGLPLGEDDLIVLGAYSVVRAKVIDFFKNSGPQYVFAERPRGEEKLQVTATHVRKGGYEITHKQARILWNRLRPLWEAENPEQLSGTINASGYGSVRLSASGNIVAVGCQQVSRWQVEQAVLELGWI